MDTKYFRTFSVEELFTEYIFSLMKQHKAFMVFPNNKQILIDDEVDEWNQLNGIANETKRILYHFNGEGYIVHYTDGITNVLVPADLLNLSYKEFIKITEE